MKHPVRGSALLLGVAIASCAATYRGDAIEGVVIEAGSGLPLADVLVVAEWRLREFDSYDPLHGGVRYRYAGDLRIREAVTDRQGRYAFAVWGPIEARRGKLARHSPYLSFHKAGYRSEFIHNEAGHPRASEVLKGDASVQFIPPSALRIALERLPADAQPSPIWPGYPDKGMLYASEEYTRDLEGPPCRWERMPRLAAHLLTLRWLTRQERRTGAWLDTLPSFDDLRASGACGDPREVLAPYLPQPLLSDPGEQQ